MPTTIQLSEERVQNSDDGSTGSRASSSEPGKLGDTNTTKRTKSSAVDKVTKSVPSEGSDNSGNESDASSASTTSSISQSPKRKADHTNKPTPQPPAKKPKIGNVKRVESSTYFPPQGYTPNRNQAPEMTSQVSNIFNDLNGKQVWHISAPSSFPVSRLKSLNVETALNGEVILQHEGISYTMNPADVDGTAVLLPKPNGDYMAANATVSRSFNISGRSDTAEVSMDKLDNTTKPPRGTLQDASAPSSQVPNTFFATRPGQKKPPRQQPTNLRARYVPYGVDVQLTNGHGSEETAHDTTMMDVPAELIPSSQTENQAKPKSSKKSKSTKITSSSQEKETSSKRKEDKGSKSAQSESPILDSSQKKKKKKDKSTAE